MKLNANLGKLEDWRRKHNESCNSCDMLFRDARSLNLPQEICQVFQERILYEKLSISRKSPKGHQPFHKTLPRSSLFVNWISARFYETGWMCKWKLSFNGIGLRFEFYLKKNVMDLLQNPKKNLMCPNKDFGSNVPLNYFVHMMFLHYSTWSK